MDSLGPRYSGSGDIGYGFVDFRGPKYRGFEQSNNGLSKEGAGTRVCGYAIKNMWADRRVMTANTRVRGPRRVSRSSSSRRPLSRNKW